jgi:hypothetical protein
MGGEVGLWADNVRGKFLQNRDMWVDTTGVGSQFWKDLHKMKSGLRLGAKHRVGNGEYTHFWLDWWMGSGKF